MNGSIDMEDDRVHQWYRAIMATTEMSEEEFERVLEMVRMNVDMNGLEQLDALVIVLEEMEAI